ncbi:MAG TPA: extracellular solute-binding protein, partial [Actinomycetes bacterium]|nr:extracellular solute-binding protein [Actinomycetes bacterium]
MKRRYVAAIAVIAALIIAGCSSSGGGSNQQASGGGSKTLTVWLMDGSAPEQLVADLNAEFQASHQGVTVNYQVQQWNGIQDKLTTALAGNSTPDVIELGNTQSAKFAASGGLLDLSGRVADLGNQNWLKGMTESGQWDG